MVIPYITESNNNREYTSDIFSRLLKDRIVMLTGEVNDESSALVCSQLLYLDSVGSEDIHLYINSPGGSVTAGMAIYDTMNHIKCDVSTICMGMAASMGAFLLAGGCPGKRYALPNSEVMIHQPLGGAKGQATDILISARNIERCRKRLTEEMAKNCGQSYDKVFADTERDNFMDAEEALAYGLVDKVIEKK